MNATVTIDSSGRLVIPRNVREKLHLHAGSRLHLEVKGDGVFLEPLPEEDYKIVERNGRLVIETEAKLEPGEIRKAILADREDRSEKLARRR